MSLTYYDTITGVGWRVFSSLIVLTRRQQGGFRGAVAVYGLTHRSLFRSTGAKNGTASPVFRSGGALGGKAPLPIARKTAPLFTNSCYL